MKTVDDVEAILPRTGAPAETRPRRRCFAAVSVLSAAATALIVFAAITVHNMKEVGDDWRLFEDDEGNPTSKVEVTVFNSTAKIGLRARMKPLSQFHGAEFRSAHCNVYRTDPQAGQTGESIAEVMLTPTQRCEAKAGEHTEVAVTLAYSTLLDDAGVPSGKLALDCSIDAQVNVFGVIPVASDRDGRNMFVFDLSSWAKKGADTLQGDASTHGGTNSSCGSAALLDAVQLHGVKESFYQQDTPVVANIKRAVEALSDCYLKDADRFLHSAVARVPAWGYEFRVKESPHYQWRLDFGGMELDVINNAATGGLFNLTTTKVPRGWEDEREDLIPKLTSEHEAAIAAMASQGLNNSSTVPRLRSARAATETVAWLEAFNAKSAMCHKDVLGASQGSGPDTQYVHWVFPIWDFASAMFKYDHATLVLTATDAPKLLPYGLGSDHTAQGSVQMDGEKLCLKATADEDFLQTGGCVDSAGSRYFSGNFEHYMKDSMNYASATKLLFPDNDHFHFGINVNDLKEGTSIFELLANFVNGKVQGPGAPKSATAAAVAPLNAGKEIDFHKNRIAVKMDSLVMDMFNKAEWTTTIYTGDINRGEDYMLNATMAGTLSGPNPDDNVAINMDIKRFNLYSTGAQDMLATFKYVDASNTVDWTMTSKCEAESKADVKCTGALNVLHNSDEVLDFEVTKFDWTNADGIGQFEMRSTVTLNDDDDNAVRLDVPKATWDVKDTSGQLTFDSAVTTTDNTYKYVLTDVSWNLDTNVFEYTGLVDRGVDDPTNNIDIKGSYNWYDETGSGWALSNCWTKPDAEEGVMDCIHVTLRDTKDEASGKDTLDLKLDLDFIDQLYSLERVCAEDRGKCTVDVNAGSAFKIAVTDFDTTGASGSSLVLATQAEFGENKEEDPSQIVSWDLDCGKGPGDTCASTLKATKGDGAHDFTFTAGNNNKGVTKNTGVGIIDDTLYFNYKLINAEQKVLEFATSVTGKDNNGLSTLIATVDINDDSKVSAYNVERFGVRFDNLEWDVRVTGDGPEDTDTMELTSTFKCTGADTKMCDMNMDMKSACTKTLSGCSTKLTAGMPTKLTIADIGNVLQVGGEMAMSIKSKGDSDYDEKTMSFKIAEFKFDGNANTHEADIRLQLPDEDKTQVGLQLTGTSPPLLGAKHAVNADVKSTLKVVINNGDVPDFVAKVDKLTWDVTSRSSDVDTVGAVEVGATFAVKDESTKCVYGQAPPYAKTCETTTSTKNVGIETTHRWLDSDAIFDAGTSLGLTTNDNKKYEVILDSLKFSKAADSMHVIEAALKLDNEDTVVGMRVEGVCPTNDDTGLSCKSTFVARNGVFNDEVLKLDVTSVGRMAATGTTAEKSFMHLDVTPQDVDQPYSFKFDFLTHEGFKITAAIDDFDFKSQGTCTVPPGVDRSNDANKQCTAGLSAANGGDQIFAVNMQQLDWNTPRAGKEFENDFAMEMTFAGSDSEAPVEMRSVLKWEKQGDEVHAKGNLVIKDSSDFYLGTELHHFYSSPADLMLATTFQTTDAPAVGDVTSVLSAWSWRRDTPLDLFDLLELRLKKIMSTLDSMDMVTGVCSNDVSINVKLMASPSITKALTDGTVDKAALEKLGFTIEELKGRGVSAADLNAAGHTWKELKDAGYTAPELAEAGAEQSHLLDAGFSGKDLDSAGVAVGEAGGEDGDGDDASGAETSTALIAAVAVMALCLFVLVGAGAVFFLRRHGEQGGSSDALQNKGSQHSKFDNETADATYVTPAEPQNTVVNSEFKKPAGSDDANAFI